MRITVLIENTGPNDLLIELGLSLLIENNHSSYLLYAGALRQHLYLTQKP